MRTLGGVVNSIEDLAASLQLEKDGGGSKVLLQMVSASGMPIVPVELFSKFQVSFCSDPIDSMLSLLGVH